MQKIEAIIRKTKFDEVKEALMEADINWFEYSDVHGIGQQRQERVYRGVQYSTDIIERVNITIICRDCFVEPTIKVLLEHAHTGEIGDGRIFISPVTDCYSIRTGKHGDEVIANPKSNQPSTINPYDSSFFSRYCVGAAGSDAGFLYATRICAGRSRPHPQQEYR